MVTFFFLQIPRDGDGEKGLEQVPKENRNGLVGNKPHFISIFCVCTLLLIIRKSKGFHCTIHRIHPKTPCTPVSCLGHCYWLQGNFVSRMCEERHLPWIFNGLLCFPKASILTIIRERASFQFVPVVHLVFLCGNTTQSTMSTHIPMHLLSSGAQMGLLSHRQGGPTHRANRLNEEMGFHCIFLALGSACPLRKVPEALDCKQAW